MEDEIPRLYETRGTPLEKKIIYQKWEMNRVNFYWFIAELDYDKEIAFGYANLNNDNFAEWGYIDVNELAGEGARRDRYWKRCTFEEAVKKMKQYRRGFYQR